MATQTINISLPKELVQKIDIAAKVEFASRSDYIRQALVGKLRADKIQSEEIVQNAKNEGYETDNDFVRAVKEVCSAKLAAGWGCPHLITVYSC